MISIIISVLVSFVTTLFATPVMIKFLSHAGIVGIDQHKKSKPLIASSGGICLAIGILSGMLTFIGLETFVTGATINTVSLLAILLSVLIIALVGIFDDLNVVRKGVVCKGMREIRVGLSQWMKPLLTLPAAIPLMVVSAGSADINLPLIGMVNVGIFYPLLLIPIGIVGASNAVNMLGGFNGLEAGMGIIYMIGLGIFALLMHNPIAILFLVSAASLLGFIRFNWYPAKILPGDSLTYLLGAIVAAGVIVGNMQRLGIIFLIPFFIEFILKLRSKLKATSLGKLRNDGAIENIYGNKIYSMTHIMMRLGKFTERQISVAFILLEILFVILGFILYFP